MNDCRCTNRLSFIGFAVAASVIIGIVTAFLVITATITLTPAFLWVIFGIAVVALGVLYAVSAERRTVTVRPCFCRAVRFILAGILGTILVSVILLAISFAATSIIGAIIAGLALFFFSLLITSVAAAVICLTNCGCEEDE